MPKPSPDEVEYVDDFSVVRDGSDEFVVTINDTGYVFNREQLAEICQAGMRIMVKVNNQVRSARGRANANAR